MDRRKLLWRLGLAAALSVLLLGAGEDEFSIRQTADGDATIVTVTGPDALLERVAIHTVTVP